ncbi:MAG: flavodoxin family protein [Victivallales bacterium]
MKILSISGSRNPNGQTEEAVGAMIKGVTRAAATAEQILLPPLRIERCRQCDDNGWGVCRTEGRCIIEDDLSAIVAKIRFADAIIFSTPVYYSDLSESLRTFLDRLRRKCSHKKGRVSLAGKPVIGICVAGGGGVGAADCCVNLEKILSTCGFDVVDIIPVRRQNLENKKEQLSIAGEWLARMPKKQAAKK